MFDFWIASPIKDGKPASLRRLRDLVRATCLRRTKKMISESLELPQHFERTETVEFHQDDRELYTFFKEKTAMIAAGVSSSNMSTSRSNHLKESNILSLINFLRLICNHGKNLLPPSAVKIWEARDRASIDWQMMRNSRLRCGKCDAQVEGTESAVSSSPYLCCEHYICSNCVIQSEDNLSEEETECPKCVADSSLKTAATPLVRPSAKIEALLRNLHAEQISESYPNPRNKTKRHATLNKFTVNRSTLLIAFSVIFTFWTKMLDLIQQAVESDGFFVQRIDGGTSLDDRKRAIKQFHDDPKCTIMLASIGSAGEG